MTPGDVLQSGCEARFLAGRPGRAPQLEPASPSIDHLFSRNAAVRASQPSPSAAAAAQMAVAVVSRALPPLDSALSEGGLALRAFPAGRCI